MPCTVNSKYSLTSQKESLNSTKQSFHGLIHLYLQLLSTLESIHSFSWACATSFTSASGGKRIRWLPQWGQTHFKIVFKFSYTGTPPLTQFSYRALFYPTHFFLSTKTALIGRKKNSMVCTMESIPLFSRIGIFLHLISKDT